MKNELLKNLYDFRQIEVPDKLLEIPVSQREIDAVLASTREKFLVIQEVFDAVREGDFITVTVVATDNAEVRDFHINVGKNVYDKEWEKELLGLTIGSNVTLPKRRGGKSGKLVRIKRRVFPEMTDELILKLRIDGVRTVQEYQDYVKLQVIEEVKEKKADIVQNFVVKRTIERSEYGDLSHEVSVWMEKEKNKLQIYANRDHTTYEELLSKITPQNLKTLEQKESFLQKQVLKNVQMMLIGQYYANQKQIGPSQEEYNRKKEEYIQQGASEAYLEERFSYDDYLNDFFTDCFTDQVSAYYHDKFRVVIQ